MKNYSALPFLVRLYEIKDKIRKRRQAKLSKLAEEVSSTWKYPRATSGVTNPLFQGKGVVEQ